jgi:2-oxoglutarate dehydrogenase E2 component (dihydrolipoamide succinyltransferase)
MHCSADGSLHKEILVTIQIKAPTFPESIADGTIAMWHKRPGEPVRRDEPLADIETEKVVIEITAPDDGALAEIIKNEGDTVLSDEVIAVFTEGAAGGRDGNDADTSAEAKAERSAETVGGSGREVTAHEAAESLHGAAASPAARKLAEENRLDLGAVAGSGKAGRITREDVSRAIEARGRDRVPNRDGTPVVPEDDGGSRREASPAVARQQPSGERVERRVPMTRLRASVARRLVEAQQNAAMLTTFNEVNMKPVMDLRRKYQDEFQKRHNGIRLGFMSFFVRAAVEALKRFPGVNASIDGSDIIYHGYYDIGVAVSTERGLVVPVVRDADGLSLAQIEQTIAEYGSKARDGKLSIEDMSGGTFTISNGGIFGSLLSTPILNPPQTGILGMHKIEERAVVEDGAIVARPMMYLALSYDHRLIDGQEAVRFLVTIKELLEDPARILLDI